MGWKVISLFSFGKLPEGVSALAQTDGPPKVFVFRDWQGAVASSAATEHVIQAFGSVDALERYFAGYMSFGGLFGSSKFLGVWGNRNASRFRRILREKLGELEVVHTKPPASHNGRRITGRRLSATERGTAAGAFRTND
jgi:hypothetical protein